MTKTQQIFEAIMRVEGHTDFSKNGDRYANGNLQIRWNYFRMGWEMREVTA